MTTAQTVSAPRPIRRVLVANRGEIACRVIDTVHRMGLTAIAVYSDADATAPHVRQADVAVRLGPAPATESYLDIDKVIAAARETGADAVHPGYGFLSENQRFAAALAEAGLTFIGPPASAIATMGDKITARAAVSERDVPVVPGISRPGLTDDEIVSAAPEIGFPVLIKPSAGGGGKGMHRVDDPADLPGALAGARREAAAAFGDDTLFLEHFVDTPRHIEVQVLADAHGNVIHLGERECSLQRRHQKVIEEAPSALLDEATRRRIGEAACDAARSVGYTGAGTVEFIVSAAEPERFFFMEMNTRLQVEHPVTELVTGVDLVEQQIRIAAGEPLQLGQDDVVLTGHAVEARVYAEDPAQGFLPTGGEIEVLTWPADAGGRVRIDSGIAAGQHIGSDYDPMLAKVIAYGADRAEALDRLDAALADTHILGLITNVDFCRFVLARDEVRDGRLDTALLDRIVADYAPPQPDPAALCAAALSGMPAGDPDDLWSAAPGWRIGDRAPVISRLALGDEHYRVSVLVAENTADRVAAEVVIDAPDTPVGQWSGTAVLYRNHAGAGDGPVTLSVDGIGADWAIAHLPRRRWVSGPTGTWHFGTETVLDSAEDAAGAGDVLSPMPGTVVAVPVADGDTVAVGDPLVVVEAMKMEHTLKAAVAGKVSIAVAAGDKVDSQQILATVIPAEEN